MRASNDGGLTAVAKRGNAIYGMRGRERIENCILIFQESINDLEEGIINVDMAVSERSRRQM